jgi:hypothetical protein
MQQFIVNNPIFEVLQKHLRYPPHYSTLPPQHSCKRMNTEENTPQKAHS